MEDTNSDDTHHSNQLLLDTLQDDHDIVMHDFDDETSIKLLPFEFQDNENNEHIVSNYSLGDYHSLNEREKYLMILMFQSRHNLFNIASSHLAEFLNLVSNKKRLNFLCYNCEKKSAVFAVQ